MREGRNIHSWVHHPDISYQLASSLLNGLEVALPFHRQSCFDHLKTPSSVLCELLRRRRSTIEQSGIEQVRRECHISDNVDIWSVLEFDGQDDYRHCDCCAI